METVWKLNSIYAPRHIPVLTAEGGMLMLRARYEDRDLCRQVPGRRWNPEKRAWEFPVSEEAVNTVRQLFPAVYIDALVPRALALAAENKAAVKEEEPAEPVEPMPVKTKPFKHQVAAYNVACRLLGVFSSAKR